MRSINDFDKQQGQALVEFALMLPVLIFLMLAIIDFSRIMFVYAQVSNSVREAARFGSVIGNDPNAPRYFDCDTIRTVAEEALLFEMEFEEFEIRYDNGDENGSIDFLCESPQDIEEGYRIRITLETTVYFITPGMSILSQISGFTFSDGLTMQFSSARTIWSEGIIVGDPDG